MCLMARLTLDSAAKKDCVVSAAIEDVLATLIRSIPNLELDASVSTICSSS